MHILAYRPVIPAKAGFISPDPQTAAHAMTIEATPILDALHAGHVIDLGQYQAAKEKLQQRAHTQEPFAQLGEGLMWLLEHEIVSSEQLGTLETDAQQQANFAGNATRKQTLDEFGLLVAALHKERQREFLRAVFPGPPWLWIGSAVVAISWGAWYVLTPPRTPACDDKGVQKTLRVALFGAQIKQPRSIADLQNPRPNMLLSTLENIQEAGYIQAERSRACLATLSVEDLKTPVVYTIGPDAGDKEIWVRSGDARVILAKYQWADADGKLQPSGTPIGAEHIQKAFLAGIADLQSRLPLLDPANRGRKSGPQEKETADEAFIQSVQPLSHCQAAAQGHYTCRLLVQYRDPLMLAIRGPGMVVVEGDFSFVKDGAAWRVAEDFQQQFLDTMVRGRVGELTGEAVEQRLEEIQKSRTAKAAPAQ